MAERTVSKIGSRDADHEVIKDYKCKGSQGGCVFGTRVCRVECDGMKGIVMYQKVKKDPELGVIPVSHSGHDLFPYHNRQTTCEKKKGGQEMAICASKRYMEELPSLHQLTYVAEHYYGSCTSWTTLMNGLMKNTNVPSHPCQRTLEGQCKLRKIL